MNIGIDGRSLLEKKWGGVSWYTAEMAHAIFCSDKKNNHDVRIFISGREQTAIHALQRHAPDIMDSITITHTRIPNTLLNALTLGLSVPHIDALAFHQQQADITWLPNWNIAAIRSPYILTVHDVSYIHYPQAYSFKEKLWHNAVNIQRIITNAHHIIAVSAFTAYDIRQTFFVPESKITVIHEGVGNRFFQMPTSEHIQQVKKKYNLPDHFILGFYGNARKNVELLHAIKPSLPIPLILIGENNVPYIDEHDKPIVYSLAECLLYPSLFEGFGLPILEAMAGGTPVIASNATSIPEVVADAGLLVSPYRPDQWIQTIHELMRDHALKNDLIARGQKRAHNFSWEKAADKWWKCVEKVVL